MPSDEVGEKAVPASARIPAQARALKSMMTRNAGSHISTTKMDKMAIAVAPMACLLEEIGKASSTNSVPKKTTVRLVMR